MLLSRSDQVALLYKQLPIILLASLMATLLLAYLLGREIDARMLAAWIAVWLGVTLFRSLLYLRYQRAKPIAPVSVAYWARQFTIGSVLTGCTWGLAGYVLYLPQSFESQMLLISVMFAIVTGCMTHTIYCLLYTSPSPRDS